MLVAWFGLQNPLGMVLEKIHFWLLFCYYIVLAFVNSNLLMRYFRMDQPSSEASSLTTKLLSAAFGWLLSSFFLFSTLQWVGARLHFPVGDLNFHVNRQKTLLAKWWDVPLKRFNLGFPNSFRALPGCICNYRKQVHHSATSPWS